MLLSISKALALPPTFVGKWRQAMDALRGPPSAFQQFHEAMDALRGPSPLKQPLFERMREGADLEAPDALGHARAPAPPPATTKIRRGAPTIHDWPRIIQFDAEFCCSYFANHTRAPSWKERRNALSKKLGKNNTPHLKTLQKRLPKIAFLKERNSRSI